MPRLHSCQFRNARGEIMVTALLSGPAHWLSRLLKFWALCALITLAAMLAHTSDNPRFFGRYSTLVFLMLLGLAIGTVAGFVGSVILQRDPRHVEQIERHLVKWRTKAWFAPLGLTAACSLLILLWFFFLGDHLETYVVLRLFLGFTILLTTLGVIMRGDTSGTEVKINCVVLGTIGLIFVAAVIVGNFYPVYHPAETLIMGMLRNFPDTGNA